MYWGGSDFLEILLEIRGSAAFSGGSSDGERGKIRNLMHAQRAERVCSRRGRMRRVSRSRSARCLPRVSVCLRSRKLIGFWRAADTGAGGLCPGGADDAYQQAARGLRAVSVMCVIRTPVSSLGELRSHFTPESRPLISLRRYSRRPCTPCDD